MGGFAWVTLATNDSYSLGALVLAHSLKQAGTTQQLAVLVTPGVTNAMREKLGQVFNLVQEVNILDSKDEANLRLLKRPELGITFTKLHCWRLTQYDKCVFLDADTLVLQNCDELFEREELSAAPDVGWPDCFNSGVFVYRPSNETYEKLIQFALEKGSFDGGDQGLLNLYFSDWAHKDISKHLPFIYNLCSTACYSYLPAFKQFGGNAKIIHFIGTTKPWLQYFNTETRQVQPSSDSGHLKDVLQRWWDIFCSLIHPNLSPDMAGLAGAFAQLILGVPRTAEQEALESHLRRQAWEVGNIDYLGRDSFENIWSKILDTLSRAPESEDTPASEPAAPTEQPKAPTTPSATEAKLPEPQSVPLQPETTAEQKQEETKQTETTAPALVSIPLESPKPEATPDQPASTAPQQTPVTEEPISQPQAAPESPAQPSDETLAPAAQELPTPVQDLPAQLAQEPPAQPTQEPPTQVQEPPVQVQELPAQPAQEPAAQVQEPPKQVQETPAQVQEAPAQVQELLAQPAQEHPAQLPQESSTQPQEPVSPVVEAEPSAAIQEKPSDEVAAEVIKSEPVTECAKVDITSAAASAETKTPEIPEPITETPPEPTPIPKSDGTKQEPVTTLPESPVEVPKATAAQPSKTSEASSVPETSPVQSLESPKIPDPVSAPEPATAAESTKLSESPVCPLKLETPKSPEEPKTPKATPAPTGELPKAEALAQVPEPKTPEAPVCPKKSTELATPKAATKATPPSTPAVEQAKEATESDTAQSQPPVEAAAVSQPQAPPRKVVKKTTKKAK